MKLRTQKNFNTRTHETVYGVSIMVDGSRMYCKYPIGYQEFKTNKDAKEALEKIKNILDNGGTIQYAPSGSAGLNKSEYVLIKTKNNEISSNSNNFYFNEFFLYSK